jgi:hypothetical protein
MQAASLKDRWRKWRKAVVGTLAAIPLAVAAIMAVQWAVDPIPLPIAPCGVNRWVTTEPYTTTIAGVTVAIPAGFTNDLASIPEKAQSAIGIQRDHPAIRRGALAHDWLYHAKTLPRATADWLLWQACLEDGMQVDKAGAVYEAVKLWGFLAWGD